MTYYNRSLTRLFFSAILILGLRDACAQNLADDYLAQVNKRVSVNAPTQIFEVATPYTLPLQLSGPAATSATISWSYFDVEANDYGPPIDATEVSVQAQPNGSASVSVIPTQIGKAKLYLQINFSDRELAEKVFPVDIKLSTKAPLKFVSALGSSNARANFRIHALDMGQHKRDLVRNYATYAGLQSAVLIPSFDVTYHILPAPGATAAFQVDPQTGRIEALQPGHAVLETTFQGTVSRNCIAIKEHMESGTPDCYDILSKDQFDSEGDMAPRPKPAGKPLQLR